LPPVRLSAIRCDNTSGKLELHQSHRADQRNWRVHDPQDIVWSAWDSDFVAFHRPSGRTHLLNAASKALLSRILAQPMTVDEVARQLVGDQDVEIDADFLAEVQSLLHRLEELGLVSSS
jgi:PqqD family protein of HPr-rel-A system